MPRESYSAANQQPMTAARRLQMSEAKAAQHATAASTQQSNVAATSQSAATAARATQPPAHRRTTTSVCYTFNEHATRHAMLQTFNVVNTDFATAEAAETRRNVQ